MEELTSRAAQLSAQGREDEVMVLRAAAHLLRLRAIQERAEAAACRADETIKAREVGDEGTPPRMEAIPANTLAAAIR